MGLPFRFKCTAVCQGNLVILEVKLLKVLSRSGCDSNRFLGNHSGRPHTPVRLDGGWWLRFAKSAACGSHAANPSSSFTAYIGLFGYQSEESCAALEIGERHPDLRALDFTKQLALTARQSCGNDQRAVDASLPNRVHPPQGTPRTSFLPRQAPRVRPPRRGRQGRSVRCTSQP